MYIKSSKNKKLYGMRHNFNQIINLYNEEKMPNKILLSGKKGVGKATLAYHVINHILSTNEDHKYNQNDMIINENNRSYKLLQNNSHPNFHLIDLIDEKKIIDIAQIREMITYTNKSSFDNMPRFILIDNIENLNKNSVNALLKIVEEPNEKTFFILIHKNLNKHFKFDKKKFIILDDAVDIEDFKFKKKIKKIKNSCVYTGSFYKGKGVEFIFELSKILPKIKFYLYGDINTLDSRFKNNKQNKNLIFRNHIEYSQIPKTLAKFEIILMPYSKKVYVKSKSIEVGQYMSPLKLFDYLASGKILIASEHENYKHILIDKINCFSLNLNKIDLWKEKIEDIFLNNNNNKLIKNIKSKARATAKKYTWKKRTTKIINFINEKKIYD